MPPNTPVEQLIEIKTELLRIQRSVLMTMTAIDALTADLQDTTTVPAEPTTEQERILLYFQRQAARALMEHAASAGALLPDGALGLTIDHDGSSDPGDVTMWSDIEAPAPVATQRQSQRTRNAALRAHARSQARAWSESRTSTKK